MGKWTLVIALVFMIGFQTPVKSAAQSDVKLADRPALVSAVRPSYPAIASLMNARGEVVIEVKIDVKGKVVSASAVSGNEHLRKSSEKAAVEWKFAAVKESSKERIARLTFGCRHADTAEPGSDEPTVVLAVAPVYPAIALTMGAKGEVVVEVTLDGKGKVTSATVISGNEYLRDSGKKAAMNWEFSPASGSDKPRTVRLTFAFRYADAGEPMRAQPEITTVFKPPYRVELILQPYIVH
jgi:TonB family protein